MDFYHPWVLPQVRGLTLLGLVHWAEETPSEGWAVWVEEVAQGLGLATQTMTSLCHHMARYVYYVNLRD
jgi:hypothetical protein